MFWGALPPPLARLPQDIYGRMKLWAALFCIMTTLPMPFHSHRWIVKIGCAKIILYPVFTWPVRAVSGNQGGRRPHRLEPGFSTCPASL